MGETKPYGLRHLRGLPFSSTARELSTLQRLHRELSEEAAHRLRVIDELQEARLDSETGRKLAEERLAMTTEELLLTNEELEEARTAIEDREGALSEQAEHFELFLSDAQARAGPLKRRTAELEEILRKWPVRWFVKRDRVFGQEAKRDEQTDASE
jgi:hypothetical protein